MRGLAAGAGLGLRADGGLRGIFAFDAPLVEALPAAALQTVSVISRVTTYGSMLAFGRRSSM